MKKLFASLVAVLALAPVVVNAAYTKGDYINFAGNESDWELFKSNEEEYLNRTGNGTIFIEETNLDDGEGHKYLRVMDLYSIGYEGGLVTAGESITDENHSFFATDFVVKVRQDLESPYAHATGGKVDVDIATLDQIKTLFGVTNVGDKVTLTGDMKTFFTEIFESHTQNVIYVMTKTADSGQADHYYALKVTKDANGISDIELVSADAVGSTDSGNLYTFFPIVLMNEAYVCEAGPEEAYACYECPTTGDQTDYSWIRIGNQAEACKKIETVTTKKKCVKNAKTGVDNYLIPSAIILGVCAIVLTVVKRKDAFRAI